MVLDIHAKCPPAAIWTITTVADQYVPVMRQREVIVLTRMFGAFSPSKVTLTMCTVNVLLQDNARIA